MALSVEVARLKGELKLVKNVADKAENGNKKNQKKKKKRKKKRKEQEAKEKQKKDDALKKIPPSPKDPQEKVVNKITYHWCIHHIAWTTHKPEDCWLGKDRSESLMPYPHTAFPFNVATGEKSNESSLRALKTQLATASTDES